MISDLCGVFVYVVHSVTASVGSSGKKGALESDSPWSEFRSGT